MTFQYYTECCHLSMKNCTNSLPMGELIRFEFRDLPPNYREYKMDQKTKNIADIKTIL